MTAFLRLRRLTLKCERKGAFCGTERDDSRAAGERVGRTRTGRRPRDAEHDVLGAVHRLVSGAGVPHVTYDTYFWKGPAAGAQGAPGYPIDTGLTAGVLPFDKVQGEVGFDLLLPSPYPFFLNMKLCTPESSLFKGSPGISFGIYNLGFKDDVSNYNVLHLMFQKAFPKGGYFAAGCTTA